MRPIPSIRVSQSRASSAGMSPRNSSEWSPRASRIVPQGRLDPGRLLLGQAARPDRLDELGQGCVLDRQPVGCDDVLHADPAPARSRSVRFDRSP